MPGQVGRLRLRRSGRRGGADERRPLAGSRMRAAAVHAVGEAAEEDGHGCLPGGAVRRAEAVLRGIAAQTGYGRSAEWALPAGLACSLEAALGRWHGHRFEATVLSLQDAVFTMAALREARLACEGDPCAVCERIWRTGSRSTPVCSGKPCIKGTRIMVRNILGMITGGYTVERVLAEYPSITREDVAAALEYASRVVDEEKGSTRG